MWGWVNAPRGTTRRLTAKTTIVTVSTVVQFLSLVLFGYSTGLPTLCTSNSATIRGTTTWQTKLGYPDVGCAGTFTGPNSCTMPSDATLCDPKHPSHRQNPPASVLIATLRPPEWVGYRALLARRRGSRTGSLWRNGLCGCRSQR